MNGEKVKQIVSEAFDAPTEQREALVRKACGDDQSLLNEVLSLLDAASHAEDDGFLPSAVRGGADPFTLAPDGPGKTSALPSKLSEMESPEKFGRYKVLERIGEGGMGIVYRAEQRSPMRREVVIKVIKLGMDTKLVIARFEAERQALAMMDHPHIAKVYDAGTDDRGRPYFVMEYVKGTPILDYCDRNHLTIRQRMELFTQVCQAIQHAHHKGIIHRDIKPSNILVSTQDGRAFAKVIDFGIAKATNQRLTDRTLFTEHVNMIGTPAYMSPEQADGNIDIDTRTDVYSLGVVLYELLTGHTPFDAGRLKSVAINELARIIREEEPLKPSTRVNTMNSRIAQAAAQKKISGDDSGNGPTLATLAKARSSSAEAYEKSLRGEVDWIVMKALEKDRARRYATPNELAEDVERHLNGLPILAAPPSLMYQARKFARKYKAPVAAGLAIAAVLVLAIACVSALAIELSHQVSVATAALRDAQSARSQELAQRLEAERQRASAENAAHSAKYQAARNQAQYLIGAKLLDQAMVAAKEAYSLGGNWQDGLLLSQIVNDSRKTWHLEDSIPVSESPLCGAISQTPTGSVMLVSYPNSLAEYDLGTGELLATTRPAAQVRFLVVFRGFQDRIAAISANSVQILSLNNLAPLAEHDFGAVEIVAADAGVSTLALTLSDDTTQAYSRDLTFLGSHAWPKEAKMNQHQPLTKLAISPDGQWVVSGGATWWNDCLYWNVSTNQTIIAGGHGQQLRFIDNSKIVATELSGDQGMYLVQLTIDAEHSTVDSNWLCTLPMDDVGNYGGIVRHSADERSIHFTGAVGYAAVTFGRTSGEFPDVVTQRYASLLGRNDLSPVPLALAIDGSRFALACKDRLLVFDRVRPPRSDWANGHNATMGATAMYEVEPDAASLYVRITPANPLQAPVHLRLATLPDADTGLISIACGAAISQDQRTLAVRYAEAQPRIGIVSGAKTRNHKVVIYSGLDPTTGRPGGTAPVEIHLITQDAYADAAAHEYRNERILQLSPDGKYLLIGEHATFESSVAELYRTADGKLIHYWPAGQLTGLVTSIGNSDCFADAAVSGNAIRLISWETGEVEREINIPGKLTGVCGAARGQEVFASIDGKTLSRYRVDAGELVSRIDSNLIPVDCTTDGKVLIGYLPDTESTGSMLLADAESGDTLAILQHGTKRFTAAQFAADGQSFMLPSTLNTTELVRNLSPDAADRILAAGTSKPTDPSAENAAIAELQPIKVFPKAATEAGVDSLPVVDATDMAKLTASIGTRVVVTGRSISSNLTLSRNGLVVTFSELPNHFTVYIPPGVFPSINERFGGTAGNAVNQKVLRVTGTVVVYHGLPEIVLDDAAHLQVVDSPSATQP